MAFEVVLFSSTLWRGLWYGLKSSNAVEFTSSDIKQVLAE